MSYDSTNDTLDHIGKVRTRLLEIQQHLMVRSLVHDESKLQEPEKAGYDQLTVRLKDVTYGTDAYRAALAEAQPTIAHHYAHNRHHPEHWPGGIADMNLIDIVEMLADWKAASERTKQGSIMASLEHNKARFGIDDQLFAILVHTVRDLEW